MEHVVRIEYEYQTLFPSNETINIIFNDYILSRNKLTEIEYYTNTQIVRDYEDECSICFSHENEFVKINKCNHVFCEPCLKKWLMEQKGSCPNCRINLKNNE